MLYIIYCKPEKNQGKKIFTKRLKENFGIDAIKKSTTREKPEDDKLVDPNLIYPSEHKCQNDKNFLKKYNTDEYFVYSRSREDRRQYYAIKKSDITECFSSTSKVLICQDIETVKAIHDFGETNADQIHVYCMIRSDDSNQDQNNNLSTEDRNFLQEIANEISKKNEKTITVEELIDIIGNRLIKTSEQVDLNFCKNVSYFDNLLIVPYCNDFKRNFKLHLNSVDLIIEKYMELQPINKQKSIFVIHPFSDNNGQTIPSGNQRKFKKFLQVVFYEYLQKGHVIKFADEIQNSDGSQSSDYDLPPAIFKAIRNSSIIVCDFRYLKHNCFLEYGYAKGLWENDKKINICLLYNESADGKEKVFDVITANKYYYETDFFDKNQEIDEFKAIIKAVQDKYGLVLRVKDETLARLYGDFVDKNCSEIKPEKIFRGKNYIGENHENTFFD